MLNESITEEQRLRQEEFFVSVGLLPTQIGCASDGPVARTRISASEMEELRIRAVRLGMSVADLLRGLIRAHLRNGHGGRG
jgi:hypothetical protein